MLQAVGSQRVRHDLVTEQQPSLVHRSLLLFYMPLNLRINNLFKCKDFHCFTGHHIFKFYFMIYFGCAGSSLLLAGFFSCSNGGYSLAAVRGLLIAGPSHCGSFSHRGAWVLEGSGSVLGRMDLVARRHVGPSRTKERTCVPCIGWWTLNCQTTREVLDTTFLWLSYFFFNGLPHT